MKKHLAKLKKFKWAVLDITLAVMVLATCLVTKDSIYILHAIILTSFAHSSIQSVRIKDLEDKLK